eukprot:4952478-Amphidinium_carterae.2
MAVKSVAESVHALVVMDVERFPSSSACRICSTAMRSDSSWMDSVCDCSFSCLKRTAMELYRARSSAESDA